jgi:hypothetical protein
VVGWGEAKKLKSVITYDDGELRDRAWLIIGSSWRPLKAPASRMNGDDWACDVKDTVRAQLLDELMIGDLLIARPFRDHTSQLRQGFLVYCSRLRHGCRIRR